MVPMRKTVTKKSLKKPLSHHPYRHYDHRFEWTRAEFKDFVEKTLEKYPDYEAEYGGIGEHWEGKNELGYCSQVWLLEKC